MNILSSLNVNEKKECICIVGAGGKTSIMFNLAKSLGEMNRKIAVTTTTKIYYPQSHQYNNIIISGDEDKLLSLFESMNCKGIYVLASNIVEEVKLKGITNRLTHRIFAESGIEHLIVECDGSRGKSIKAPADFEPVIPACATKVIGVIGLDALGEKANEATVHRLDSFCKITECEEDEAITAQHVNRLINHSKGIFKDAPDEAERYLVLNKADNEERLQYAEEIIKLLGKDCNINVLITQMQSTVPIQKVWK